MLHVPETTSNSRLFENFRSEWNIGRPHFTLAPEITQEMDAILQSPADSILSLREADTTEAADIHLSAETISGTHVRQFGQFVQRVQRSVEGESLPTNEEKQRTDDDLYGINSGLPSADVEGLNRYQIDTLIHFRNTLGFDHSTLTRDQLFNLALSLPEGFTFAHHEALTSLFSRVAGLGMRLDNPGEDAKHILEQVLTELSGLTEVQARAIADGKTRNEVLQAHPTGHGQKM
jgi:hypothetical protein